MKISLLKKYLSIPLIIFLILVGNINVEIHADNKNEESAFIDWQKGFVKTRAKASIIYNNNGRPVDIRTGTITSVNKARKTTYYNAREKATQNLAETIKSIRVDYANDFTDLINANNTIKRLLSEILLKSVTIKEYPTSFDTSVCELKLNFEDIIKTIPYHFPSNEFPSRAEVQISTNYSSLIIDGRGTNIKPMLFPSIYGDDGLEIYGRHFIISSYASRGGMASYCFNEKQARKNSRAGEHPFFTTAIKIINNCPVITEKATRRILSSKHTINNLKKCRIIFIIDKYN